MAVSIARQALGWMAVDPDQSLASCPVRCSQVNPNTHLCGGCCESTVACCATQTKGRDKQRAGKREDRCGRHTRVPEEVHGARPVARHLDTNLDPANQSSLSRLCIPVCGPCWPKHVAHADVRVHAKHGFLKRDPTWCCPVCHVHRRSPLVRSPGNVDIRKINIR